VTAGVVHRYHPRGAAHRVLESRDPEILLSGPAGTGKSRACLEKLHLQALKYPKMRGLIARKTQTSLGSTALVTFREHVAAEALASGAMHWYGGSGQRAAAYQYRNGSEIVVGGMDKSTKIMSSEYDVAYVQEAIELTVNDWEAITTRLRNGRLPYQQIIADTNPDVPTHWLKVRCDEGATSMLESRHEDNPVLFGDDGRPTERGADYLSKLDALTGVRFQRLRNGLWVAAEGMIYEEWDPAIHVVDRFPIPRSWTRWWAVDFGYTNPQVIQMWAEDPDGRLYLYREIYYTRRTVDQHARQALSLVTDKDGNWTEPRPRGIICDHDAEGRAVLERELGMGTIAATKTVTDGIQAFQARLRPAGDGKPRLFVLRDSVVERDPELVDSKKPACTAEEIPGYVWAIKPGGELKEEPAKENDHGADAARYLVAERDLSARPRVRFM
jgi:phage terminase large subunit